ncbi:MAG: Gfo/Idh/MocA family oxidoreductase [Caldilineaceae bacterium]
MHPWTRSKYYAPAGGVRATSPAGLVLDGGVHHMAVLRLLMGEISHVAAMTQQLAPDLPPLDTMTATLRFADGAQGVYTVSYALDGRAPQPVVITGDDGVMSVYRDQIRDPPG